MDRLAPPWSSGLVIALNVGAALSILYFLYLRALPRPIPGIPYNSESASRLLGDLPNFLALAKSGGRTRDFWSDLARRHDSAITQFFMGPFTKPNVVVSDFRETQDLLLRRSREFDHGDFNNSMWGGVIPRHFICMNTRDPGFADAKRIQRDLMTPNFLHNVSMPSSYSKALDFIELWRFEAQVANGAPFNALKDLDALTADMIFAAALGIERNESNTVNHLDYLKSARLPKATGGQPKGLYTFPDPKEDELLKSIQTLGLALGQAAEAPSQRLYWFASKFRPAIRDAQATRRRILQSYIDRAVGRVRVNRSEDGMLAAVDYMVARELSSAEKAGRAPVMDSEYFHDMLYGYLLGGQDTTHSVMSFLIKRLGAHQATQATLRRHLREAHRMAHEERRNPTREEVLKAQVPYLDAFIEEVLRCNTPSPVIIKEATSDMLILGSVVPKGTQLFFPLWGPSINESASVVSEEKRSESCRKHHATPADWMGSGYPPKEFHVERWLKRNNSTGEVEFDGKAGPFLTFSLGNRECWGKRLAYLQLRLLTTLIVWNFEFLPLPAGLYEEEIVDVLNAKPKTCLVRLKSL